MTNKKETQRGDIKKKIPREKENSGNDNKTIQQDDLELSLRSSLKTS